MTAINASSGLMLAYVTGRHLSLAQQGIKELGLPAPHWFVCDVGTSIYQRTNGGLSSLDEIYRQAMTVGVWRTREAKKSDAPSGTIDGLELQEEGKQGEFKVSYYTAGRPEPIVGNGEGASRQGGRPGQPSWRATTRLTSAGSWMCCRPASQRTTLFVFLHDHAGVDEEHLVYAGDSGNDRAALLTALSGDRRWERQTNR